jgi:hypothetical protein
MDAGVFTVAFLAAIILYLWWLSCTRKEGLENDSSRPEKILEQTIHIQTIYDKLMKLNITPELVKELQETVQGNEKSTLSLGLVLQQEQAVKSAYPTR